MGMSSGVKTGGLQTEINITPLIDVVLVLLIIFLVTMPILMKMVTLEVPRKLNEDIEVSTTPSLVVKVMADLSIEFSNGDNKSNLKLADLPRTLRPLLDAKLSEKVVFVDFEDQVPWTEVVGTMDTIRSLSSDSNHEEVKVALKLRPDPSAAPQ